MPDAPLVCAECWADLTCHPAGLDCPTCGGGTRTYLITIDPDEDP